MCNRLRLGALLLLQGLAVVAAAAAETPADFPTFGIKLTPPANAMSKVMPDAPGQIAFYQLQDINNGAAILAEIAPGGGRTLEAASKALGEQVHATPGPVEFLVDLEKAVKFSQPIQIGPFTSRVSYLVMHNGWLYIFSALNTPKASASTALETMLHTVEFEPTENPTRHFADFFSSPLPIFGKFTINAPRFTRPTDRTEKQLHLIVYDYSKSGQGTTLNIDVQRIQTGSNVHFPALQDKYSAALAAQLKSPAPFVWHAQKDVPGLYVSEPQKITAKLRDGGDVKQTNRFCMLELAPGEFAQIVFTISDLSSDDVSAYIALSERMLATVRILPEPASQPTAR